jgi:D-Tyr-tRNAtyr deacylase
LRAVVQRVTGAEVLVEGDVVSAIGPGLLSSGEPPWPADAG